MTDTVSYLYPRGKILVFAKAPVYGRVKTRLAADIGEQAALDAYRELLEKTLRMALSSSLSPVELWLDDELKDNCLRGLTCKSAVPVRQQSGIDLGERMRNAFQKSLEDVDFSVLIGADCPMLGKKYLNDACNLLNNGTDIVIGPAEDGGYVLIGLRDSKPQLFESIAWGTESVMQQTRRVMCDFRWRYEELSVLWDVDRVADWRRWMDLLQSEPIA